jgi:hypothetical protein
VLSFDQLSKPLLAGITHIIQNTSKFGQTIPTSSTGRATGPSFWITKDIVVINVKIRLTNVLVKFVAHRFPIVTNQRALGTRAEATWVTNSIDPGCIFTQILRKQSIEDAALQLPLIVL